MKDKRELKYEECKSAVVFFFTGPDVFGRKRYVRSLSVKNISLTDIFRINADDRQFCTVKKPRPGTTTYTTTRPPALTYERAGALAPSPPCLGGGATRVGPGQYPQYTRADFGQEAVDSSLHRDHRRPPESQAVSPTHSTRLTSRAW